MRYFAILFILTVVACAPPELLDDSCMCKGLKYKVEYYHSQPDGSLYWQEIKTFVDTVEVKCTQPTAYYGDFYIHNLCWDYW